MRMGIYVWRQLAFAVMLTTVLRLGSVLGPRVATAATYYVATTGNDSRSCVTSQTITTPKQTIQSGIACLTAGDTLYLRQGTYQESILSGSPSFPSGTSWANPVTIASYPG